MISEKDHIDGVTAHDAQKADSDFAAGIKKAEIGELKGGQSTTRGITKDALAEAARINRLKAQKAADLKAAQEAQRERELLLAVKRGIEKDDSSALKKARQAEDPEVRENLLKAAIANEYTKNLREREKKAELSLAQLLQMAAITMQAATAMNSMDGTNSAPGANQTFDPTKPVAPKAALAGRSPASLGDKEGTVSAKSDDPTSAEGGQTKKELSAKDKETLAKIKTEVEAAEKRKKIQAMRLRQKLRAKMNAQGKDGAVDTDELFGGSLNQGMESAASEETEESAAKESAMSVSSVYQAAKAGFSLAGAETDREVGQIVSEAERDLSSEDMSSGVLGRESPSLFTRVHAVHQACQRQKCVLAQK